MFCNIYKITNTCNDKVYIGQTWQKLSQRFNEHKSHCTSIKLKNAMNKYGKDKFQIVFLTLAHTQEMADHWEMHFIERYNSINNGYNIKSGGSHGKHSPETIAKLSGTNNPMFGRTHTLDARMRISEANKGRPANGAAISATRMGQPHPHKGTPRKGIKWGKKHNNIINLEGKV